MDWPTSSTGYIAETGNKLIEVTSIDDFVSENNISSVNVIKIDVEGFGANVFEGMKLSIDKFKPVIFFEIHNNEEYDTLMTIKEARNYELYNLKGTKTSNPDIGEQIIALPL